MFSPIVNRSLVYAGLISNPLAIIVCLIYGEYQPILWRCVNTALWLLDYMIHKKRGMW